VSLGAAGRSAVLPLFARSSLRSRAGPRPDPPTPGGTERRPARPARGGPPLARGEHEHEPRVAQGAHRAALVGPEVREETDATGHTAAILRDLDLAFDDEQVGALVDLMFLQLLAARQAKAIARVSSSERNICG